MRLWIFSDAHLESADWDLPPQAERPEYDVMIVAGDLITRMERGVTWLLARVQDRPVVYVMGNHEAYGTGIERTLDKARRAAAGTNVHVLENDTLRIGDVTVAGCCLWTDFGLDGDPHRAMIVAGERMNDYRKIRTPDYRRFRPEHALSRHFKSIAFLKAEMRRPRGADKLVVVTHHAPVRGMPREGGPGRDRGLDPAYRSDLARLMSPIADDGRGPLRPADLWIHGHTHESFDGVIGATRVVSNPKGYGPFRPGDAWENHRFDPTLVIEI